MSIERARQLAKEILRRKRSGGTQPFLRILDAVADPTLRGQLDPATAATVARLYQRPSPTGGEQVNAAIASVGADECRILPRGGE
jgi:hypothetical protein